MTMETMRLKEAREGKTSWKKWGPYLSERQWGTVREDYSPNGDAWNFFTHDQARSRAYRWGEDGVNDFVVQGWPEAVNPGKQGTKVAAHCRLNVGAGQTQVVRLRLSSKSLKRKGNPFDGIFDKIFAERLREADAFYQSVTPPAVGADAANVMRQALAGMLWSKQFFFDGDNGAGLGASHQTGWTSIVAKTIQLFGLLDAEKALAGGKNTALER